MTCKTLLITLGLVVANFRWSQGHGYLMDPPARSSMWRENFNTPRNYNDNQLNCGGYFNQWSRNRGKCGICGDPFEQPQPRDNESGGKYGKGVISRTYTQGQEVTFKVMITANHFGWFEFRLCPDGSPTTPVTEACLDRYLLQLADGSGTRFDLGSTRNAVSVGLRLPAGVTCTQCVLQWKWHAGNNNGVNPDMTSCLGCGPQEEFYGCADIAITGNGNNASPTFPNAAVTNPATFAPVQFDTFPTVPNLQARTTQAPNTPRPSTLTVKPTGGFMPITLPTRGPQMASSGSTTGNGILPSSFKPLDPLATIRPITSRPQPTMVVPQTAAPIIQTQTPGPHNSILPSSFKPITPRVTFPPVTSIRPQPTMSMPQTTSTTIQTQTPRPSNILPSSFKPITPRITGAPITFRPQPTITVPQTTTLTTQSQTLRPDLPVSFQPITPRPTASPISVKPQTTIILPQFTQVKTTPPHTPCSATSMPTKFQPITPHPTAPLTRAPQTTKASTAVYDRHQHWLHLSRAQQAARSSH